MRKTISLLTAVVIAGSMSVTAWAANTPEPIVIAPISPVIVETPIQITVNGQFVTADTYRENNGIMVPIRTVAEALGFQVTWHTDQTVHLNDGNMQCDVAIGQNNYIVYTANPDLVGMSAPFTLEAAPELKNSKTYVPLSLFIPLFGNDPDTISITENIVDITPETSSEENTQIPSPLTNHKALAELEQAVGFTLELPSMPDGYMISSLTDIHESVAQISYKNSAQEIIYRVSKGTEDNSGNYIEYSNSCMLEIEGTSVQLRGEDQYHVALWYDNGFTYSVYAPAGLTTEQVTQIVTSTLN